MNIWLINHYAVPPQYYPLARQTYFAKHLMAMGHTVTLFAASTVHNSDKNLITDGSPWREEWVDGVHYVYIKCVDYQGNGLKRIYNICEFAWKLPGVCKQFPRPDAIVATSMPPTSCAVGIRLARKYGCKGVAEIADLWPESIVAYGIAGPHNPAVVVLRWLEKWIYTRADDVVFTMEGAYDYIVDQGWEKEIPRSKVHFINNGVDLPLFDENREKYRIEDADLDDPDTFKVVYAGSLRKANHMGLLLDAAKLVTDPRVRFLMWGAGDEVEELRRRVKEEEIRNVVIKGSVEKKYIPGIVSRADLNVMHMGSDKILRFGVSFNKMFEALAAGRPLLSGFSTKYNPSVQRGAGISVPEMTAEQIAGAVEQFVCMDKETYRQMCENARRAAEAYDFKRLTEHLVDIIEKKEAGEKP